MYKKYVKENKDTKIFDKVKWLRNKLNSIIDSSQQKYYSPAYQRSWLFQ